MERLPSSCGARYHPQKARGKHWSGGRRGPSALRLPEPPAVHDAPVVVAGPSRRRVVKGIVGAELSCGGKPGHEAGLLAVDQGMTTTVPRSSLALDAAAQVDEKYDVAHVMDDVLEPPPLDDLSFIDGTGRALAYGTGKPPRLAPRRYFDPLRHLRFDFRMFEAQDQIGGNAISAIIIPVAIISAYLI